MKIKGYAEFMMETGMWGVLLIGIPIITGYILSAGEPRIAFIAGYILGALWFGAGMAAAFRVSRIDLLNSRAFKTWVHNWLDEAGVPKEFPDGPHTREGCRIGDRLEWVKARLVLPPSDAITAEIARRPASLDTLEERMCSDDIVE